MKKKIVYGLESSRLDDIRWLLDCILDEHGHGATANNITFKQDHYEDGTILSTNIEITVEA